MKYWKEILFFSVITAYYIVGIAPDMTWLSQGGDAFDYVIGSERMWAVRPTGYPTYILLGWLFQRLPFNPFWNLGLFSALSSVATCVFIFLTIKLLTTRPASARTVKTPIGKPSVPIEDIRGAARKVVASRNRVIKLAPYLGALTYAGAFLIWTQSVVPEVYALTTLLMVMATYFALRGKWYICAAVLAVGLGTHHIIVFAAVPLLVYFLYQKRLRLTTARTPICLGIGVLGLLPYLQTQLCVVGEQTTSGLGRVVQNSLGTLGFLYTLPLNYTWWRLGEFIPVLLTSVGTGLVLLFFLRWNKKIALLVALTVLPISYYALGMIPMWIVYMVPGIAFLSILIGIGASRFPYKKVLPVFLVVPVILMVLNLVFYDLGRSVDPQPTTARQFYTQLDEIPDNAIFYIHTWGEPWLVTYYYLVENDYRFDMVFQSEIIHSGEHYTDYLESNGVRMPEAPGHDPVTALPTGKYAGEDYFENFDTDKYLVDMKALNPGRPIYASVGKTDEPKYDKLHFTLMDITDIIGTRSNLIEVTPFGE